MFNHGRHRPLAAALLTAVLVLAGCGTAATDTAATGTLSSPSQATGTGPDLSSARSPALSGEPSGGADQSAAGDTAAGAPTSSADVSYPVTVQTPNGTVTIDARPTHIVSLSPTATEMLYAIGAGDQVVAVDKNSSYPEDLPDATFDAYQLNIESLTKVDPDLVISSYIDDDQAAAFDALGMVAVAEPSAATIDDTYRQIEQLGTITGHHARATDLVRQMKAEIDEIVTGAPSFDTPPTYYYELDQTFYSVTSDTFIGQLLGTLGLTSIADRAEGAAASGGYPQLSAEFIVDANPDYIFLSDSRCCGQSPETVAARPGWDVLDAVTGQRVISLDDDIASRWGPRVPELLRTVADAMREHPAAP